MLFWIKQFFSNRAFHIRAAEEVVFVAIVSILPLLVLPVLSSVKAPPDTPFAFEKIVWEAIASGQLYLYSFSLFATIMWLCVEDISNKEFPPRKYFVLGSLGTAFLCILVYGADPSLSKPLNPTLISISVYIYIAYLFMYYSLLVFKMLRAPDVSETTAANVNRLISQSENRTGADT
jgi:hypothetical protein